MTIISMEIEVAARWRAHHIIAAPADDGAFATAQSDTNRAAGGAG